MNYWPQEDIDFSDSPVTVTVDDRAFWCDTSGGDLIFDLPSVVGKAALYFVFKKDTSDSNTITINAPSGKTIDGASSYVLSQYNQIIGVTADTHGNYKLVDGNSSGAAVGVGRAYIEKVDADFTLGGTAVVTNTTTTVDLPVDGDVVVTVSGTASYSGQPTSFSLGVRIDGTTDYMWEANASLVGAGSDYFHYAALSHRFVIPSMAKGSHTFAMIAAGANMTLLARAGEPASMIIEYVNVTNFGGGNPTSDPTNDLSGTWDTVQVVGLQNDRLPVKTAGGFLRRNITNTAWEYIVDVTNVRLDGWHTPIDVTLLNATSTYHGLLPKLPLVGGFADVTNYLRADGSWATPPGTGTSGSVDPLIKAFFTEQSLLPANTYKEAYYTFPAADFSNLGTGGAFDRSMSRGKFTALTAGGISNIGWDMGAAKSQILMLTHMRTQGSSGHGQGLYLSPTLPAAAEIPDNSYLLYIDVTGGEYAIYKKVGGVYTKLGSVVTIIPPTANDYRVYSIGVAFYYDDSSNRLICFVRHGSECWFPVIDFTDTTFTTFRYCGYRNNTGANVVTWLLCPFGIYNA